VPAAGPPLAAQLPLAAAGRTTAAEEVDEPAAGPPLAAQLPLAAGRRTTAAEEVDEPAAGPPLSAQLPLAAGGWLRRATPADGEEEPDVGATGAALMPTSDKLPAAGGATILIGLPLAFYIHKTGLDPLPV
jgi:hypothetical protein